MTVLATTSIHTDHFFNPTLSEVITPQTTCCIVTNYTASTAPYSPRFGKFPAVCNTNGCTRSQIPSGPLPHFRAVTYRIIELWRSDNGLPAILKTVILGRGMHSSAICKVVWKKYPILQDTLGELTSASKYFSIVTDPPWAKQCGHILWKSIHMCSWTHRLLWRCIQHATWLHRYDSQMLELQKPINRFVGNMKTS